MSGGLVVGLGCRPGVRAEDVRAVLGAVLDGAGLAAADVFAYATLRARGGEPGLRAVTGDALLCFPAGVLGAIPVPNPSRAVATAVGTPAVAEAAALCAAADLAPPGSVVELVVPKRTGAGVTAAVARFRPA
jgi:cobalt-precorrin 5A hydrolase